MKQVKSLLLFGISVTIFSGCLNQPELDNSPKISFEDIYFVKSSGTEVKDALTVSLDFKDGDGDLGLTSVQIDSPFHEINFFANHQNELLSISSTLIKDFTGYHYHKTKKTPKFPSYYLGAPPKNVRELITLNSRNEGFSLPPYESPFTCTANKESYLYDTIFVFRNDKHLIKNKTTIVDSLYNTKDPAEYYYAVLDYFYINVNPSHYNIKVDYLVKNNDGTFTEYDWRKELCTTFDGRFPILATKDRPLEGTINYSMVSSGFTTTFSTKTLKLSVNVYDRALHSSNTIETPEFRLDEITR